MSDKQIDVMAGFCAGIVSNFIAHPLDTIKVRLQTDKTQSLKLVPTIKSIYHQEGVRRYMSMIADIRSEDFSRAFYLP